MSGPCAACVVMVYILCGGVLFSGSQRTPYCTWIPSRSCTSTFHLFYLSHSVCNPHYKHGSIPSIQYRVSPRPPQVILLCSALLSRDPIPSERITGRKVTRRAGSSPAPRGTPQGNRIPLNVRAGSVPLRPRITVYHFLPSHRPTPRPHAAQPRLADYCDKRRRRWVGGYLGKRRKMRPPAPDPRRPPCALTRRTRRWRTLS